MVRHILVGSLLLLLSSLTPPLTMARQSAQYTASNTLSEQSLDQRQDSALAVENKNTLVAGMAQHGTGLAPSSSTCDQLRNNHGTHKTAEPHHFYESRTYARHGSITSSRLRIIIGAQRYALSQQDEPKEKSCDRPNQRSTKSGKSPEFQNTNPHSGLLALASGIPGVRGSKSGIPKKDPKYT